MTASERSHCLAVGNRVVALAPSVELRHILTTALRDYSLTFRDRAHEIIPALRTTGASVLLVGGAGADATLAADVVAQVALRAPGLRVIVLKRASDGGEPPLVAYTSFSMADVLLVDAPHFAERVVTMVRRTGLAERLTAFGSDLSAGLPLEGGSVLRHIFQANRLCLSVEDVRAGTGVGERSLEREMETIGVSARTAVAWKHLTGAVMLNESTFLTLDRVAHHAEYSSRTAYDAAVRGLTGVSRDELMQAGGSKQLITILRRRFKWVSQ